MGRSKTYLWYVGIDLVLWMGAEQCLSSTCLVMHSCIAGGTSFAALRIDRREGLTVHLKELTRHVEGASIRSATQIRAYAPRTNRVL